MLSARVDRPIGIQGSHLRVLEEDDSIRSDIPRQWEPVVVCGATQFGEVSSKAEM